MLIKTGKSLFPGYSKEGDQANKDATKPEKKGGDFLGLVAAYQATHGTSKSDAIKAIAMKFPEAHRAYLRKHNPNCYRLREE